MNTFVNHYPLNFVFLSFPYVVWYDISVLLHYDITTFFNTFFFCSSGILKSFKAKPQKSIQWFNFSYMGKTGNQEQI